VKDDLQRFHEKNMATDPHYAIARHLLDLGEAVAQLREQAKMTRGQLGKRLASKRVISQSWKRKRPARLRGFWKQR
jgi:hypothetical protein